MAVKNKRNAQDETAQKFWRKPLQVPPRTEAMRNFYQGSDDNSSVNVDDREFPDQKSVEKLTTAAVPPGQTIESEIPLKNANKVKTETQDEEKISDLRVEDQTITDPQAEPSKKLTTEDLSRFLGFETNELFDVHELLRGKSMEIYRSLFTNSDEKGRCKITQTELMKRSGIKNRRTFYKHEQWLINLKLLEKRHLPGDHQGIVYRVIEISDALPVSGELVRQFEKIVKESVLSD